MTKNVTAKNTLIIVWLIACLSVGIFLRFYQLGKPGIWIDELTHIYAAQSLAENGRPELLSGHPYPRAVLFSEFVSYAHSVFGVDEFSSRLPSAIFSVLCMVALFFIANRWFGVTTALLSVLFLTISPFVIGWARICRMYTLFQLLTLAAMYTFYLGFESENKGFWADLQKKLFGKIRGLNYFLECWRINVFWLLITLVILYFAYLTHQLAALFIIGIVFYFGCMFVLRLLKSGFGNAIREKYGVLFIVSLVIGGIVFNIPGVRSFLYYAVSYTPKWAVMPKFQNPMLYVDFLFDKYSFPMGVMFIVGVFYIFARRHQFGIYAFSMFAGTMFMFSAVFSYRHLQYIYNVYPILIILSAFAISNIVYGELSKLTDKWSLKINTDNPFAKAVLISGFLIWLPLAPGIRLAKNIPFMHGSTFNGAVFLTELKEAGLFLREQFKDDDLIISTEALGVHFYVGKVDYDLNFADLDVAKNLDLKNEDGDYIDLYSGAPFIKDVAQLQQLLERFGNIWVVVESYKFFRSPIYVPETIREFILTHFNKVYTTADETMVVFYYENKGTSNLN